jgi:hypothetical protein
LRGRFGLGGFGGAFGATLAATAFGDTAFGDTAFGDTAFGDTALRALPGTTLTGFADAPFGPALVDTAFGDTALGDTALGDTALGAFAGARLDAAGFVAAFVAVRFGADGFALVAWAFTFCPSDLGAGALTLLAGAAPRAVVFEAAARRAAVLFADVARDDFPVAAARTALPALGISRRLPGGKRLRTISCSWRVA